MAGKANEWTHIGVRLSNCRQNRNMTQEEVAGRLGVTPQAVSKWERGISLPDISMLSEISRLLGVSTDWLLGVDWLNTSDETENNTVRIQSVGDRLRSALEPLELVFGLEVVPVFTGSNTYLDRIMEVRKDLAWQGIWMPVLRLRDNSMVGKKEFMILACHNVLYSETLETVGEGTLDHIIEMLRETVSEKYHEILYPDLMKDIVENLKIRYPALIEGVVPEKISYSLLTEVSRIVLAGGNGICYLPKFIEIMDCALRQNPDLGAEELAEKIRSRIERSDNFWVIMHDRKEAAED